jgi:hypothetical protein
LAAGPVFPNLLNTTPNAPNLASLSLQFTAAQLEIPYSEQGRRLRSSGSSGVTLA